MKRLISVFVSAVLLMSAVLFPGWVNAAGDTAPGAPTGLRIDMMSEPYGIDPVSPSFSWIVNDKDPNETQTAYEIIIASSKAKIDQNTGDITDTGKVVSGESSYAKIAGLALNSNSLYYWKVKTWDASDLGSDYSAAQAFTTAVGNGWANTKAIWAGTASNAFSSWSDYTLECDLQITAVALGLNFYETSDAKNFYMWQFKAADNTLNPHTCVNGTFTKLDTVNLASKGITLAVNTYYHIRITVSGSTITCFINGTQVDQRTLSNFTCGGIGLRTGSSESGSVKNVSVYTTDASGNKGKTLYADNFASGKDDFSGGSVSGGALSIGHSQNITLSSTTMQNFVFVRDNFNINSVSKIDKAVVSVTASSPQSCREYVYNIYMNGKSVGFGPARSIQSSQTEYNTYDVTSYLQNGANTIGAINYATTGKQFLLQMTVYYADGTSAVLLNSGRDMSGWKTFDGTAAFGETSTSVGTAYYSQPAENINAAQYPFGWDTPGFDDSAWAPAGHASADFTAASLVPAETENMNQNPVSAVKVVDKGNGDYFIDFGQEVVGQFQLTLNSSKAQTVTVECGEELSAANTVKYQMRTGNTYSENWSLTAGDQTLQNFGMKSFRYVEILKCADPITANNVKAIAVRQDFNDGDSSFTSSDSGLNAVYNLCKYTVKATNQDLYVDSQSRERGVYEGDALINMLSSYYVDSNMSLARYSTEYLDYNRQWPADYKLISVMLSYYDYLYTGNLDSLQTYYGKLKFDKLYDNMWDSTYNLLKRPVDSDGTSTDCVLVDWPSVYRNGYDMTHSTYNTAFNALAYGAYADMAKIAQALGNSADADAYSKKTADLKTAMIKYLYDPSKGLFYDGLTKSGTPIAHYAQLASAYPLALGVVDDKTAQQSIVHYIDENGMKSGVYGAFWVLTGLYNADGGSTAMKLLTSTGTNSWLHVINNLGATIATEAWDPSGKANMTFSHAWGSAPGSQIPAGVFGIQPTSAGYKTFQIRFQPGSLTSASITVPSVKGTIGASFNTKAQGYAFSSNVTIPVNATAAVSIPASGVAGTNLVVDGSTVAATQSGNYLTVTLGSGAHTVALAAPAPASSSTPGSSSSPASSSSTAASSSMPTSSSTPASSSAPASSSTPVSSSTPTSSSTPVSSSAQASSSASASSTPVSSSETVTTPSSDSGEGSFSSTIPVTAASSTASGASSQQESPHTGSDGTPFPAAIVLAVATAAFVAVSRWKKSKR